MSFDLKKFLTENKLTKNSRLLKEVSTLTPLTNISFPNGLSFEIGDDDPYDDGRVSYINKQGGAALIIFMTGRGEGYGRYYDAQGNEITEEEFRELNTLDVDADTLSENIRNIVINGKKVDSTSVEVEDIDTTDAPDFSDAYISYAEFEDGTPLTEEELEQLGYYTYEFVEDIIYENKTKNTSFNLKKFLTENKLTKTSIREEASFYTMDEVVDMANRAGEIVLDAKDALNDLAVAYGYKIPHNAVHQVLDEYDLTIEDVLYGGESSSYEEDMDMFNEETEMPVVDEPAAEGADVSRYLNLESAEAVIKEIESEIARVSLETKINKIKEAIEALDGKANGLEEDSNLEGFVNPARLKEMRRMTKKLRIMQERYAKEYDKKFNKKKNKKVTTEAAQRAFGGTKTVHTAGSVLEPILGQVNSAGSYNAAKAIVLDAISNSGVAQEVKDKMIADVEGTRTYDRLLMYVYNAYLAKAGLRSPDSGSRMKEGSEEGSLGIRMVSRADAGKAIRGTTAKKTPMVGADYKGMKDDQIRTVKRPVMRRSMSDFRTGNIGPSFKGDLD